MDLRELREKYPFKPFQLALLDGLTLVEVISYPWQEGVGPDRDHTTIDRYQVRINVRLAPGDPTSMQEVDADRLTVHQPQAPHDSTSHQEGVIITDADLDATKLKADYLVRWLGISDQDVDAFIADFKARRDAAIDPDSVDGLIAKLQALPADVRKLKAYVYVNDILNQVKPEVIDVPLAHIDGRTDDWATTVKVVVL